MRILQLLTLITLALNMQNESFEMKVRNSVRLQMEAYPESTLKDLYKNFFQDRFGPGHIINDKSIAGEYLSKELDSYSNISGQFYEVTGWENNFYRVNLSSVKKGIITEDQLLDALVRSANETVNVDLNSWLEEWSQIEQIIKSMELSLPGYYNDSEEINQQLKQGKYVGHHSKAFNNAYSPHYRIISRNIFEEELLPLFDNIEN